METQPLAREDDSSGSAAPPPAGGRYQLSMRFADGTYRHFAIKPGRSVIGRLSRCNIHVALPMIGKEHCELVDNGHGLELIDLGTDAGTLHNGKRVETASLRDGDRIGVGPVEFTIRDAGGPTDMTRAVNTQPASTAEVVVVLRDLKTPQQG